MQMAHDMARMRDKVATIKVKRFPEASVAFP